MTLKFGDLSGIEILFLTITGEARGERIEGQVAVGCVIRNRLYNKPNSYHTYHDVCLAPKQFSCWNDNDPNRGFLIDLGNKILMGQDIQDPYLRQCRLVADGIYNWDIIDNTRGAKNYLENRLILFPENTPKWAKARKNETVIGSHTFFNA